MRRETVLGRFGLGSSQSPLEEEPLGGIGRGKGLFKGGGGVRGLDVGVQM